MAILYRTAKLFKSTNNIIILLIAIWGSIAKFNARQYFRLYGMLLLQLRQYITLLSYTSHHSISILLNQTHPLQKNFHNGRDWLIMKICLHNNLELTSCLVCTSLIFTPPFAFSSSPTITTNGTSSFSQYWN